MISVPGKGIIAWRVFGAINNILLLIPSLSLIRSRPDFSHYLLILITNRSHLAVIVVDVNKEQALPRQNVRVAVCIS